MGSVKKVAAGAIIGGGGFALQRIGELIFSATGETAGPHINYATLITLSSSALMVLGGILALYGVLEGAYALWKRRKEESSRSSPSGTPPSSRKDRPRSPSRS